MSELIVPVLLTIITASTPLVFAAVGEIVVEKSGVLNLGVEGMMIVGAVLAFAVGVKTESAILAILSGAIGGMFTALIFGFLTLKLLSNQVATGLALTIFGLGLSALIGHGFVGKTFDGLPKIAIPLIDQIPILGSLLFVHDPLVFLSVLTVFFVSYVMNKTRLGLIIRAVGENHHAAHSIGYSVVWIRMGCVLFGGSMAGLGGAYLSLAYTPLWVEGMTAGRGWIALALVVFASWRASRAFFGAYLFGGITIIQLHAQGFGVEIASQFLSMLPYLATIVVLVLISNKSSRRMLNAPADLGKSFHTSD